jgi:hypothetical protein
MKTAAGKRVSLIGDSIRLGYEPYVRALLKGHRFVSPRENSGDSMSLLEHFDAWFLRSRAHLIHANCGLHDVRFGVSSRHHQGSPSEYEANLGELIERMRALEGTRVVWALTTPVIEERHNRTHPEFTRSLEEIQHYNAIARRVMVAFGIPVHDLYSVVLEAGPESLLGEDGVHFTEEGNRRLGKSVADFIAPLL